MFQVRCKWSTLLCCLAELLISDRRCAKGRLRDYCSCLSASNGAPLLSPTAGAATRLPLEASTLEQAL